MNILFLTHSFNSLAQRLFIELTRCGHDVSLEFDISDSITEQAVELYRPDLVIAPFLKRAIPETVWRSVPCFVVHPGIIGDRGPSALDWALMHGYREWGVTVLQANSEMDAGDMWAYETFSMRFASKSSLYRHEVTEAAVNAVLTAVDRFLSDTYQPIPLAKACQQLGNNHGKQHMPIRQMDRAIEWQQDDTHTVLKKIFAADGFPGVLDSLYGAHYYLFDAWAEATLHADKPGAVIAQRQGAICRATVDGAVWIGHLKQKSDAEPTLKLPATVALNEYMADVPVIPPESLSTSDGGSDATYRDIWFEQSNQVGYLYFVFYNGAMSSSQCERLREAYVMASQSEVRVIVLMGGPDFWSNGIHLNLIEHAASPADESWRNINAMNDLVRAIITNTRQLTLAALQGNAGAGGVFLSLAADRIYARKSVILNPHYKSMGNLYGSEYWTYLLPKRVGKKKASELTDNRLPIDAADAQQIGLIDGCFELNHIDFRKKVEQIAQQLAASADYAHLLASKQQRRERDEREKPLDSYRAEELQQMQLNFYGFDPSYHVARYHFVFRIPHAWTPLYLARHRQRCKREPGE
ncbi:hydrogenase maturation protein [Nitrosomonas sp. Nm34]|uniref:hydrogenase maturation protein n=1 Tax=Nitrosomonas sp. Nm34 TaxID=1881055 RepID=UPI0008DEC368|nr:hydrogenase maturation protein [Nitrosomonas sp. Nm34]SFI40225.1 putative two-component system protein, hydrogenase maturation factor HypX/HoxX [Nitrosomonas sp. Nm34]